ncbi:hypothetical protein, partial [Virgibacillus chiguensis]|uniref:hypothetical protein n=1 Tax=Virgibacillus chiguensis TaxID=411959 RepID=UPI001BB0AFEA
MKHRMIASYSFLSKMTYPSKLAIDWQATCCVEQQFFQEQERFSTGMSGFPRGAERFSDGRERFPNEEERF